MKVFILREERDEMMNSTVVNTWTAELEDTLYTVPGKPTGVKERSYIDGFKRHQRSSVK